MNSYANTKEKNARDRANVLHAFLRFGDSAEGKLILEWLHATAGTRKPAFLPGAAGVAIDPFAAAYRDGRHSIIWEIEANIDHARRGESADKPTTTGPSGARVKRS